MGQDTKWLASGSRENEMKTEPTTTVSSRLKKQQKKELTSAQHWRSVSRTPAQKNESVYPPLEEPDDIILDDDMATYASKRREREGKKIRSFIEEKSVKLPPFKARKPTGAFPELSKHCSLQSTQEKSNTQLKYDQRRRKGDDLGVLNESSLAQLGSLLENTQKPQIVYGTEAILIVVKALVKAFKKKQNNVRRNEGFSLCDMILYRSGSPMTMLYEDNNFILVHDEGYMKPAVVRAHILKAQHDTKKQIAEICYYPDGFVRLNPDPHDWKRFVDMNDDVALVIGLLPVAGRYKHQFRHDTPRSLVFQEETTTTNEHPHHFKSHHLTNNEDDDDDDDSFKWTPLRSQVIKRQLDTAVRHLVQALEAGLRGRRVLRIDTMWLLDERRDADLIEESQDLNGKNQLYLKQTPILPKLQRAFSIELSPIKKVRDDVSSVTGISVCGGTRSAYTYPNTRCSCPGGFCAWKDDARRHAEVEGTDQESGWQHPDQSRNSLALPFLERGDEKSLLTTLHDKDTTTCNTKEQRLTEATPISRSSILEAYNEAVRGDALDFWPQALVLWCMAQQENKSEKIMSNTTTTSSLRHPLEAVWMPPRLGIAFPTKSSQFMPSQIIEIAWVCRGPAPAEISIELVLHIDESRDEALDILQDEFLVAQRHIVLSLVGSSGRYTWQLPSDINGTSPHVQWQIVIAEVQPRPGLPRTTAKSAVFSVVTTRNSTINDMSKISASREDVSIAMALLRSEDNAQDKPMDESRVRRWDKIEVCPVCYQVYAELSRLRSRWLEPRKVAQRKQAARRASIAIDPSLSLHLTPKSTGGYERLSRPRRKKICKKTTTVKSRTKKIQDGITLFDSNLPAVAQKTPQSAFLTHIESAASRIRNDISERHPWAALPPEALAFDDDDDEILPPQPQSMKPIQQKKQAKSKEPARGYEGKLHPWQRLLNEQIQMQDDFSHQLHNA